MEPQSFMFKLCTKQLELEWQYKMPLPVPVVTVVVMLLGCTLILPVSSSYFRVGIMMMIRGG